MITVTLPQVRFPSQSFSNKIPPPSLLPPSHSLSHVNVHVCDADIKPRGSCILAKCSTLPLSHIPRPLPFGITHQNPELLLSSLWNEWKWHSTNYLKCPFIRLKSIVILQSLGLKQRNNIIEWLDNARCYIYTTSIFLPNILIFT
jgi:hypothetical protein